MKIIPIDKFFLIVVMLFPCLLLAQTHGKLSNKNASKEARALYAYLNETFGKKILSGQMYSGWGFDEFKYVYEVTGKYPAIKGLDFIDSRLNDTVTQEAIDWWKSGGIVTMMWHMGAPGIGEGYINSKKEIDIDKCFQPGTVEFKVFWDELKQKGDLLERLKKAHVPVLWRPFHELNGNWFWWSKQGPEKFKKLWVSMYNYYVKERKLTNLIWVLCYTAKPDTAWYPGDKYVDIAGADTYNVGDSSMPEMYKAVKNITGNRVPIPYHECGVPPNPDSCFKNGAMWSWWMEWHTNFIRKVDPVYLKYVYNHDLIITKDELPDIMSTYGKK
ncbi:MAG: glycoside hydrolase family 26 protein [Bacteroidota bacterium]|nr:glycoside hydrolase family 26 protein [Bacteroidota bacterium]